MLPPSKKKKICHSLLSPTKTYLLLFITTSAADFFVSVQIFFLWQAQSLVFFKRGDQERLQDSRQCLSPGQKSTIVYPIFDLVPFNRSFMQCHPTKQHVSLKKKKKKRGWLSCQRHILFLIYLKKKKRNSFSLENIKFSITLYSKGDDLRLCT